MEPPLETDLLQPGVILGDKYEIETQLGEGGMGTVFAARNRHTGRKVAVKWLLPHLSRDQAAVKRLEREALSLGRINDGHGHDNVVAVIDVGQHGGSAFIIMEYLQGEPLAALLRRQDKLSPEQTLQIMGPAMRGVHAAHEAGVIHRDLKPDNIFLATSPGRRGVVPKVLDFGISKLAPTTGQASSLVTLQGAFIGTVLYMAPEQVRGRDVDARTDVFALGVIMYELLSGELPFIGETVLDVAVQITDAEPRPLGEVSPELPPSLCAAVMQALAKDPNARQASVAEFLAALEPGVAPPGPSLPVAGESNGAAERPTVPPVAQTGAGGLSPALSAVGTLASRSFAALRSSAGAAVTSRPRMAFWALSGLGVAGLGVAFGFWGQAALTGRADLPLSKAVSTDSSSAANKGGASRRSGARVARAAQARHGRSPAGAPSTRADRPGSKSAPRAAAVTSKRSKLVQIVTTPPGARLRIDGNDQGRTPKRVRLPLGTAVWVQASLPGHAPRGRRLRVKPDTKRLFFKLPKAARKQARAKRGAARASRVAANKARRGGSFESVFTKRRRKQAETDAAKRRRAQAKLLRGREPPP